jgi:hypothetical protein
VSVLGRLLAVKPLQVLGKISYEVYLWHWPVICELTSSRLGLSGPELALVQVGVSLALGAGTHYFIAQPVRRWRFHGIPVGFRVAVAPAGMVAAVGVMIVATIPTAVAAPAEIVPSARHVSIVEAPRTVIGGPIRLGRRPTKADPLRIQLFGDSVMRGQAPAVEAAFDSTHVVQVVDSSFDGWGFTTDVNWRKGVPAQIAAAHAGLVVVMWSFDDGYLVAHPATYRSWMEQFTRIVLAQPGVAGLVYEEFPQLGPLDGPNSPADSAGARKRNLAVDAWNKLARAMVKIDPNRVVYLPFAGSVETVDHHFTFWLPPGDKWSTPADQWVRVRSLDSVHFCPVGAARYTNALLRDLTKMFKLPKASPDWSVGPWTKDQAIYEGPLRGCPNDHPA